MLVKIICDLFQYVPVILEHLFCLVIAAFQNILNFFVNFSRGGLSAVHHRSAIKITAFYGFQTHKAEFFRHTKLSHHGSGNLCSHFNIVGSACCHRVACNFLCGPSRHVRYDPCFQFRLCAEVFLLLRRLERIAQRSHGPWHNGDLLHRF